MQRLPLVIFSALALYSVCFAQDQPTPQVSFPNGILTFDATPVIDKKDGATITIAADRSEYEGGAFIRLDITLTNTGDKPFTLFPGAVEDLFFVEVTGPNGKPLPEKPVAAAALRKRFISGEPQNVKPGQSKKASVWLTSFYDMSRVGSYKMTAQTFFHLGPTGKQNVLIKSEPVTIKVNSYPPISEWR